MADENRDNDKEVKGKVEEEKEEKKQSPLAEPVVPCTTHQSEDLIKIVKNPCVMACSCIIIYGVLLSFIGFSLIIYLFGHIGQMEQHNGMTQLHVAQLAVSMLSDISESEIPAKQNQIRLLLNVLKFARPDCTAFKTRSKTNLECLSVSEKLERINTIYQEKYTYTPPHPLEEPDSSSLVNPHQVLSSYEKLLRERLDEKTPCEKIAELSERVMEMHPFPKPYEIKDPPVVSHDVRITMNMDQGDECVKESVELKHVED